MWDFIRKLRRGIPTASAPSESRTDFPRTNYLALYPVAGNPEKPGGMAELVERFHSLAAYFGGIRHQMPPEIRDSPTVSRYLNLGGDQPQFTRMPDGGLAVVHMILGVPPSLEKIVDGFIARSEPAKVFGPGSTKEIYGQLKEFAAPAYAGR